MKETLKDDHSEVARKMSMCEADTCVSQRQKSLDLLWCVSLDNQSADSVCANPALASNTRKAEHPLKSRLKVGQHFLQKRDESCESQLNFSA